MPASLQQAWLQLYTTTLSIQSIPGNAVRNTSGSIILQAHDTVCGTTSTSTISLKFPRWFLEIYAKSELIQRATVAGVIRNFLILANVVQFGKEKYKAVVVLVPSCDVECFALRIIWCFWDMWKRHDNVTLFVDNKTNLCFSSLKIQVQFGAIRIYFRCALLCLMLLEAMSPRTLESGHPGKRTRVSENGINWFWLQTDYSHDFWWDFLGKSMVWISIRVENDRNSNWCYHLPIKWFWFVSIPGASTDRDGVGPRPQQMRGGMTFLSGSVTAPTTW